jgi:hypothetical protein
VLLIPEPVGDHRRILLARWPCIRRLVLEAQHLQRVDLAIVVADVDSRIGVGALLGSDAVVAVADIAAWAVPFLAIRPWVPILVVGHGSSTLAFARAPPAN